jgi:hypothetical protein
VFGISGRISTYKGAPGTEQETDLSGKYTVEGIEELQTILPVSIATGQKVISPLYFLAGDYKRYLSTGAVGLIGMDKLLLPPYTMMEVDREKNIRTTGVNGGLGQVTEMYGFKPWNVKIYGFAYDNAEQTADEQLREILEYEVLSDAIGVRCTYLDTFGIKALSILSISSPQLKGMPKVRAFQMNCISEQPTELTL